MKKLLLLPPNLVEYYLYMVAKCPEAAAHIRNILTQNPPNACARFPCLIKASK